MNKDMLNLHSHGTQSTLSHRGVILERHADHPRAFEQPLHSCQDGSSGCDGCMDDRGGESIRGVAGEAGSASRLPRHGDLPFHAVANGARPLGEDSDEPEDGTEDSF